MNRPYWNWLLGIVTTMSLATPALAGDGVIEINAAAAAAGGVSSTDTPGYPVTLVAGTSYRLASDLRVSNGNLTVVEGVVPQSFGFPNSNGSIKLDLNGFSIRCFVGVIGIPGQSCNGNGIGIDFSDINGAVVQNGMVRGMGSHGILLGENARVENVEVINNDDFQGGNTAGIRCGNTCTIKDSVASLNGRYGFFTGNNSSILDSRAEGNEQGGIRVGSYSLLTRNVVYDNGYQGIQDSGYSMLLQNQISQNGSYGIDSLIGAIFTYGHNTLVGNNSGGAQVDGFGRQIESNFCQTNTICP